MSMKRNEAPQGPRQPSTVETARSVAAAHERATRHDLAALIPIWPHELADRTHGGRLALLSRLRRALRSERQRGIAGHWAYDLARHARLVAAYRVEIAALQRHRTRPKPAPAGNVFTRSPERDAPDFRD